MATHLRQPQLAQTLACGTHLILGVAPQTTAGNVVPTSCHVVRATASFVLVPPSRRHSPDGDDHRPHQPPPPPPAHRLATCQRTPPNRPPPPIPPAPPARCIALS